MNKLNFSIISLAALIFCGCQLDDHIAPQVDTSLPVLLYNEIVQVPTTRVDDEGFCDGDKVGIYVVNYEDGQSGTLKTEGNQADNVKYVYNETEHNWTPEKDVFYKDASTHVDIIGYYPYAKPESVTAYSFEVQRDQSTSAQNGDLGGYEASDFLWGIASDIEPTATRISLKFYHKMAGVQITLVEGENWDDGEWNAVEKAALITNTKRNASINIQTGDITATGEVQNTGIVPYENSDEFRAIVVPQTISAGTALLMLTVDGVPYTYKLKNEGAYVDCEYQPGKLHKLSVRVSKKAQGDIEFEDLGVSITAWETDNTSHDADSREYIVINVPKANTTTSALKQSIAQAGYEYAKIKHLKVTGNINTKDFYFMRDEMVRLQSLNLKEVTITENKIPDSAFSTKSTLVRFVFPEKINEIGRLAFYHSGIVGSLIIPDGVVAIHSSAFSGCSALNGMLSLPKGLRIIGDGAFFDCSNLTGTLNIPESVQTIESQAFRNCKEFTGSLILPENISFIGDGAFIDCINLTGSLSIPQNIETINGSIFFGCGFNGQLILPDGLVSIGNNAFRSCKFKGKLTLPETLISIGEFAFSFNNFSGELVLPKGLAFIGGSAFAGCQRLTGVLEIPKEIISIPASAFSNCNQLEGVVLPSSLENIADKAFSSCYQLNSIVCKANTPPTAASTAFNGIAKDNFTVEVPEASLNEYKSSPVWKEFKRISAHRDFSISRSLFRVLNASETKEFVLRAEANTSWTVEAPEWITVTPNRGTGKETIRVTVNEMAAGDVGSFKVSTYNSSGNLMQTSYNGRSGKVVFNLTGKDYTSSINVEQYDYRDSGGNYLGDGTVITNQTKGVGNGVNIVFMGDCFDAQDIATGKYLKAINEAIEHFFAIEPYKTYKNYFNIYTIIGLSPESGIGSTNTIREVKFGSQYGLQAAGSVGVDEETCFEYACKAPTVTEGNINQTPIVLVENSTDYDGITYMWGDGSAIALCPMSEDLYPYDYRGIVQHEAGGHAFGKLGDEYIYHNAFIQTCVCADGCGHEEEFNLMKSYGFYDNLSLSGNMYDVPWSHLIFDEKYSGTVDIYEGGFFHTRGVFRSEPNSCMNDNRAYFSAISRESIVKRIMKYAGEEYSFARFKANDKAMTEETKSSAFTRSQSVVPYTPIVQNAPVFMGYKPNMKRVNN